MDRWLGRTARTHGLSSKPAGGWRREPAGRGRSRERVCFSLLDRLAAAPAEVSSAGEKRDRLCWAGRAGSRVADTHLCCAPVVVAAS